MKPPARKSKPRRGSAADTSMERAVVRVYVLQVPVDAVNMSTSLEYCPVKLCVAAFNPPANTTRPWRSRAAAARRCRATERAAWDQVFVAPLYMSTTRLQLPTKELPDARRRVSEE